MLLRCGPMYPFPLSRLSVQVKLGENRQTKALTTVTFRHQVTSLFFECRKSFIKLHYANATRIILFFSMESFTVTATCCICANFPPFCIFLQTYKSELPIHFAAQDGGMFQAQNKKSSNNPVLVFVCVILC